MKKFRSCLAILLSMAMVLTLLPGTAFGDGEQQSSGAVITVGSITEAVEPGSTISIPVTIADNPGFAGATFDIEYDEDVLEPAKNSKGASVLFKLGSSITEAVNEAETDMSLTAGESAQLSATNYDFEGDGEILTLNFKVKDTATVSSTAVSLKLQGGLAKNFSDIAGSPVSVSFVSGTVAINAVTPVASCNDVDYPSVTAAMTAAEAVDGQATIKLLQDATEWVVVSAKDVIFDLNGYTLTLPATGRAEGATDRSAFYFKYGEMEGASFTIRDTSKAQSGTVALTTYDTENGEETENLLPDFFYDGDEFTTVSWDLTITGGTFTYDPQDELSTNDRFYGLVSLTVNASVCIQGGRFYDDNPDEEPNLKTWLEEFQWIPDGYEVSRPDSDNYWVVGLGKLGPVVTVTNTFHPEVAGTFDTLEEAFSKNEAQPNALFSFNSGSTATLLRDSEEETASYGRVDTLNLNGHTIGTLKLIGKEGKNTQSSVQIYNDIINGTINSIIVQGCTGTDGKVRSASISIGNNTTVGTIDATACVGMSIHAGASITTINYNGTGNPYIYGGTIGTLNVQKTNSTGVDISGGTISSMTVGTDATVKISGGTFGFDPTQWLNTSYTDAQNGYHFEVQKTGEQEWQVVKVIAPRFVVNGVNYEYCSSACTAAGNGGTVTLGSAYKEGIDVSVSGGAIVDINGHNLKNSYSSSSIISAAQGTLKNTGSAATVTLTGTANIFNASSNSYTTTIDTLNTTYIITGTGKLLGNSFDWVGYKWGNFVIKNGTFNITADQIGTYFNTLTIEGGSFKFDPTQYVDASKYHVTKNIDTDLYDVTAHTLVHHDAKAATCTEAGWGEYDTCSCGYTSKQDIPALGHHKVTIPAVAATTFSTGLTEGWYCDRDGCDAREEGTLVAKLPAPESGNTEVEVVSKTDDQGNKEAEAEVPADAFEQKEEGSTEVKPVTIKSDVAEITFDSAAASKIAANAGEGAKVSLSVTQSKGTEEAKQVVIAAAGVETEEVKAVFTFDLKVDGQDVFGEPNAAGSAEVAVPYTPADENAQILVFYIDGAKKTLIPAQYKNGKLVFTLEHFSDYVVCEHAEHTMIDHICTQCGEFDATLKFYFAVTSGNTVDMIVSDDYSFVVRLPESGLVNTDSATISAAMQNVDTLGVSGVKRHSVTVNTGLGSTSVNLKTWLSNAYGFNGATINVNIDGNTACYTLTGVKREGSTTENERITGTADTEMARAAWQALTSHVSTESQTADDSFIVIGNGSFIKIGTEHLCFEDTFEGDLKLDNFSDLDAMEQTVRSAVTLAACEDQKGTITLFAKKGTKLAVGQTVATLNDDYMIVINVNPDEMSALTGVLAGIRDANGKTEMVKKLVDAFNAIIGVVDASDTVTVTGHVNGRHDEKISADTFSQKEEGSDVVKPVTVTSEVAEVIFDSEATAKIAANAGESTKIDFSVSKTEGQNPDKQTLIVAAGITASEATAVFTFEMKANGNDVYSSANAAGSAKVTIPYTPADENAEILLFYIDGSKKTRIPVQYEDGKLTFTLSHFSDYAVCEHTAHDFVDHICTQCGEFDATLKFYFAVTSGNTVDMIVGDDYNLVVRLPEDGAVNTDSATIYARMQNVASLGVSGVKQHSVTVNTGLGSKSADLKTWLSNAYAFSDGKITASFDGNEVTYTFARTDCRITGTANSTEAARAAWQALTSHVSTGTQAADDSFIVIGNGSFIKIGTEYLRFEDTFEGDLKLDNFSDLDAMEQTVRNAVTLAECEDQKGKITLFVKKGTKLAVGQTVATLNDDYMVTIEADASEVAALKGALTAIRDASGKTEMVKKLIETFNKVIGVVDACSEVKVAGSVVADAMIRKTDGTVKYYSTAAEALAAIEADDTMVLREDISGNLDIDTNVAFTLDLNGHTITADLTALVVKSGTLTVIDSDTVNTGSVNAPIVLDVQGGSVILKAGYYEGELGVSGAKGALTIEGGRFAEDPSEYLADGYEAQKDGNYWTVSKVADAVASVDGKSYSTLQAAVDAADGRTVKLIPGAEAGYVLAQSATIAKGRKVTIDLNGVKIGVAGIALTNKGTLTITDSSEAQTGAIEAAYPVYTNSLSVTIIKAGSFNATEKDIYKANGAIIEISGGKFTFPVIVEDCADEYVPDGAAAGEYTVKKVPKVVVTVTSMSVVSGSGLRTSGESRDNAERLALMQGGGEYTPGRTVTLVAPDVAGYTFVGWEKSGVETGAVSTEKTFSFIASDETAGNYIAVYQAIQEQQFSLTVNEAEAVQKAADSVVTVNYEGEDEFLYWVVVFGEDEVIASKQKEFTFVIFRNTVLKAVTAAEKE